MSGKYLVKALFPLEITDAMLLSSSVAEPDVAEPAWSSATTYAEFAQVSVITANSHLVYESLAAGNYGHAPAASPDWWILKSYTNRWRMFEFNRGTASQGVSPLTIVLRPGSRINAVMLFGLTAANITLTVQSGIGGAVVLSIDKNLLARNAMTPYEWAFLPYVYDKSFAIFDVPPVADPVVTITLTHPGGACGVERLGTGMTTDLGEVEWESAIEDENYSDITYESGKAVLTPAPNWPGLEMTLEVRPNRLNRILQFKELANGRAVMWSAMQNLSDYEQMHMMLGPYQRFRLISKNHRQVVFNLKIRGI